MAIADHATGLPVLRALSLCTCCHHYPGTASGRPALLFRPAVSAFPDRVVGSACASSFSRIAQCSLTLRPAHSRCHQFVTRFTRRLQPFRFLHSCSGCFRLEQFAGRGLHPLGSATFSRRKLIGDDLISKIRRLEQYGIRRSVESATLSRCESVSGLDP